jgi:hypothetical protein
MYYYAPTLYNNDNDKIITIIIRRKICISVNTIHICHVYLHENEIVTKYFCLPAQRVIIFPRIYHVCLKYERHAKNIAT